MLFFSFLLLPLHKPTIDPMKGPRRKSLCQVHVQMDRSVDSFRMKERLFFRRSQLTNHRRGTGLADSGGGLTSGTTHLATNDYCRYRLICR